MEKSTPPRKTAAKTAAKAAPKTAPKTGDTPGSTSEEQIDTQTETATDEKSDAAALVTSGPATPESSAEPAPASGSVDDEHGRTRIAEAVVEKIAGIATRQVRGVHALGGATSRTVGAIKDRIPGSSSNLGQGIRVEVGERQTACDIDLVADYGVRLPDLAADLRTRVITAVEELTGLEVTEVNITVHDVWLDQEEEHDDGPRVV